MLIRAVLTFQLLVMATLLSSLSFGFIENANFEFADPNGAPSGWEYEDYSRVQNLFFPQIESVYGSTECWILNPLELRPFSGSKLLTLSSGNYGSPGSTNKGVVRQEAFFNPGETFSFKYFFGTCDYFNEGVSSGQGWNDCARMRLIPVNPESLEEIKLVWCHLFNDPNINGNQDLNDNYELYRRIVEVGDYGSMIGWQAFAFTFDETNAGEYIIEFSVHDTYDYKTNSYLCIDDILCGQAPLEGDLSIDMQVNLNDIAIFAQHLGENCSDPNNNCDYINIFGETKSIDYNEDGMVLIDDAIPIISNWLWQP